MNINPTINPRVIQVIQKQVTELMKNSPEGIQYALNESDILDIQADIFGPVGTPYEGGAFRCKLVLSSEFPRVPPKGFFLTKIFHPNISDKGEICVNTLKKDWDPTNWSLKHVFEVIRCLLIVPFPESALNEEAGKVFMEDYEEYSKHARLITELYALSNNRFVQPMSMSQSQKPVEKPKSTAMDISFENTQEDSPTKQIPEKEKPSDNNFLNSLFKTDRPDEVLMPVTNSLHANSSMSPLLEIPFKKSESLPAGSIMGGGIGIQVSMNGGNMNGSLSAKKENDDKKKWRKRI